MLLCYIDHIMPTGFGEPEVKSTVGTLVRSLCAGVDEMSPVRIRIQPEQWCCKVPHVFGMPGHCLRRTCCWTLHFLPLRKSILFGGLIWILKVAYAALGSNILTLWLSNSENHKFWMWLRARERSVGSPGWGESCPAIQTVSLSRTGSAGAARNGWGCCVLSHTVVGEGSGATPRLLQQRTTTWYLQSIPWLLEFSKWWEQQRCLLLG